MEFSNKRNMAIASEPRQDGGGAVEFDIADPVEMVERLTAESPLLQKLFQASLARHPPNQPWRVFCFCTWTKLIP